jgi:hypothetical protein
MATLKNHLGILAVAVFGLGCAEVEDDDDVQFRGDAKTSGWGCRTCDYRNSATAGLDPIGSFHVGFDPNEISLVGIRLANGTELAADISGGRFRGTSNGQTYEGSALVGGALVFRSPVGYEVVVEIYSYAKHGDWVTGAQVDTYGLAHADNGELANVCPGYNLDETAVVVIAGERYDDKKKRVESAPDWGSLGCRGHAVAKMKLMGYAPDDGYGSDAAGRQATYKMLTADYCGSGHSFTVPGTPLDWHDVTGNFPPPAGNLALEAKWDASGATCLDTPRLAARDDVLKMCPTLPRCDGDTSFGTSHWVTQNP